MVTGLRRKKLNHPEHAEHLLANLCQFWYQRVSKPYHPPLSTKKHFQSAMHYEENQAASLHPSPSFTIIHELFTY